MKNKKDFLVILPYLIIFALLTWMVSGNSFFWDTIQLGSKQAQWFYENNFRYLFLPNEIDSGHPPVFGMYLALCWKLFGKTLAVSHWAMFPFLSGIIVQAWLLIRKLIDKKYILPALALFLADPTLLSQSTLVSPDIVLVFFFLMAINLLMNNKKSWLVFVLAGLSLISMRGMMAVIAVFLIHAFVRFSNKTKSPGPVISLIPYYFIAVLPAVLFLIMHYFNKGWIGYHPSSNWASSFKIAGFREMLKNILILGWRLADFGRIFSWIFMLVFIFILSGKKLWDEKTKQLAVFSGITLLVISPFFIIYHNLSLHRYLLPAILMMSLFTVYLVFQKTKPGGFRVAIYLILLTGLLSGNLWKYPQGIATGWDATLGHLPYYKLRSSMIKYLDEQKIPIEKTGSAFPNLSKLKYTDLSNDLRNFKEKDVTKDSFIVESNIFNDFSNNEMEILREEYSVSKEFEKYGIHVRLYERKK